MTRASPTYYQRVGARETMESSRCKFGEVRLSSENYRYYPLDAAGRLQEAFWLRARSDSDAMAQIEAEHAGSTCEIWQGRRMVARVTPAQLETHTGSADT
jgi:hypothetical protein